MDDGIEHYGVSSRDQDVSLEPVAVEGYSLGDEFPSDLFKVRLGELPLAGMLNIRTESSPNTPSLLDLEYLPLDYYRNYPDRFRGKSGCYVVRVDAGDGREWFALVGLSTVGNVYKNMMLYTTSRERYFQSNGITSARFKIAIVETNPTSVWHGYHDLRKDLPHAQYILAGRVWSRNFQRMMEAWNARSRSHAEKDRDTLMKSLEPLWSPWQLNAKEMLDLGENLHGDSRKLGNGPGIYVIRSKKIGSSDNWVLRYVGQSEYSMYGRTLKRFSQNPDKSGPNYYSELRTHEFDVAYIAMPREISANTATHSQKIRSFEEYMIRALGPTDNTQLITKKNGERYFTEFYANMKSLLAASQVQGGSSREMVLDAMQRLRVEAGILGYEYTFERTVNAAIIRCLEYCVPLSPESRRSFVSEVYRVARGITWLNRYPDLSGLESFVRVEHIDTVARLMQGLSDEVLLFNYRTKPNSLRSLIAEQFPGNSHKQNRAALYSIMSKLENQMDILGAELARIDLENGEWGEF